MNELLIWFGTRFSVVTFFMISLALLYADEPPPVPWVACMAAAAVIAGWAETGFYHLRWRNVALQGLVVASNACLGLCLAVLLLAMVGRSMQHGVIIMCLSAFIGTVCRTYGHHHLWLQLREEFKEEMKSLGGWDKSDNSDE